MKKVDKLKDFILKVGRERKGFHFHELRSEDIDILNGLIGRMKKGGLLELKSMVVGSYLMVEISNEGLLFLLEGGYSNLKKEEVEMSTNDYFNSQVSSFFDSPLSDLFVPSGENSKSVD